MASALELRLYESTDESTLKGGVSLGCSQSLCYSGGWCIAMIFVLMGKSDVLVSSYDYSVTPISHEYLIIGYASSDVV